MRFSQIFYIISFWNTIALSFRNELFVNRSANDESTVLADIVSNFLIKYFKDDQIYLSIIPPFRNEESYFFDDFIFKLFENLALKNLPHSILHKLDGKVRYKHSFFLIFISDNESLA